MPSLSTFSAGVSLWLVPAPAEMDVIKSALPGRRTSATHDDTTLSPSSYPTIIPHITLATVPFSNPRVPEVLYDAIPEHQKPIRVNFQSLVVGDHYFRSVFIDVEPTQELVGFQNELSTYLRSNGFEPSAPRFPHMSLCYVADEDASDRDRTARALRDTGVICPTADDTRFISFQCGDVRLSGLDGTEIWVVNCQGPVETWQVNEKKVKLIPLDV